MENLVAFWLVATGAADSSVLFKRMSEKKPFLFVEQSYIFENLTKIVPPKIENDPPAEATDMVLDFELEKFNAQGKEIRNSAESALRLKDLNSQFLREFEQIQETEDRLFDQLSRLAGQTRLSASTNLN